MKKLYNLIEKVYQTGKLPKYCSLADFNIIVSIYNEIIKGKNPEFISFSVKKILDNCGIITAQKEIGWIVVK